MVVEVPILLVLFALALFEQNWCSHLSPDVAGMQAAATLEVLVVHHYSFYSLFPLPDSKFGRRNPRAVQVSVNMQVAGSLGFLLQPVRVHVEAHRSPRLAQQRN